jgi:hypothetical protein
VFRRQALEEQEEAIRQLEIKLARESYRKLQAQVDSDTSRPRKKEPYVLDSLRNFQFQVDTGTSSSRKHRILETQVETATSRTKQLQDIPVLGR